MYKNALVAKQQMEAVGFKLDLQVVDWATLVQRRNKPDQFDVFSTAITFNPEPALNTGVQCNWPGWWCLDDKEQWLDSAARESDPRKRKVMWEKVQQLFYEDVGRIKFGDWFGLQVHSKELKGFVTSNEQAFFNVWLTK
jgi:peptide/nickel transport system substrate-binding protein